MSQFTGFSVSTPSRHPANQKAYDSTRHQYQEDYVNPKFWDILLHPSLKILIGEEDNGRPIFDVNIASLEWKVKQVNGSFEETFHRNISSSILKTTVRIPAQGEYEITFQVNFTNGSSESNTRKYNFRDFLIVSIGDSFASGQGNPDIPTTSSIEHKAKCKATTITLSLTKLKESIEKFLAGVKEEVKDKIQEYIPFLGKIAVAQINSVEDVIGFLKGQVADLKDAIVDVGKVGVGLAVEGAEEVASWFGFGDGGESDEVKPRPAGWQEPHAYRSYRSGHSLAARQIEMKSNTDRITFLSFARTGSEIKDGLLGPRTIDPNFLGTESLDNRSIDGWTRNRGQVEEVKDTLQGRPIDALIISIGVNDLGFSTLTSDSIFWEAGEKRKERIASTKKKIEEDFPENLQLLKNAIESQLNPKKVFITEYPVGVFSEIETQGPCGILGVKDRPVLGKGFLDLDTEDAKALGKLGRTLNNKIREKAHEFGWILIDGIVAGFVGHGYCSEKSYFVFAEESCLNQGDFEGMLHPNKLGHEVARDCIAQALHRELIILEEEKWLEPMLYVMMS